MYKSADQPWQPGPSGGSGSDGSDGGGGGDGRDIGGGMTPVFLYKGKHKLAVSSHCV